MIATRALKVRLLPVLETESSFGHTKAFTSSVNRACHLIVCELARPNHRVVADVDTVKIGAKSGQELPEDPELRVRSETAPTSI